MIDIGANLTGKRFKNDLDDVILRAKESGVSKIMVTGTSVSVSEAAFELTQRYVGYLYSTAGVHPHDASEWTHSSEKSIRALAQNKSVVALGECGLDFNRDFSPRDKQKECFEAQLILAKELRKPVFLHQRDAHSSFYEILQKYRSDLSDAVVHCFTGSLDELRAYLDLGCYIGITGWVCDSKRGESLRQIVKFIPSDRLMIETDAPYLTPHTIKPKPKRNEPAYLSYVLKTLSELLNIPEEELAQVTSKNAEKCFGLQL